MSIETGVWAGLCTLAITISSVLAQTGHQPIPHQRVKAHVDTGPVRNLGNQRATIFSVQIDAPEPGVPWMRLHFDNAQLGRTPIGGSPTQLKITSLLDGKYQLMNALHLEQWQNSSAYFNGDSVLLEIIADPAAPPSHIVINEITVGVAQGGIASICGPNDDRVLSEDPRAGRIVPIGCTGWLFNDANHCFLSAGHCLSPSGTVEFNVPLSTSGGSLQHPGPEDQYAVDPASVQSASGSIGNDWWYFGCFPNSNTGLTPYEAQQDFYILADAAPAVNGQTIRITGYGVDNTPPQNNQVQQTHAGPYVELTGNIVKHQADTTGGNSGSAVFNETDGVAIGVHTHAGCNSGGGANQGTAIHHPGLQSALDNPDGVCIPMPSLQFVLPDGIPSHLNPTGDSIRVEVQGSNGGKPESGTGKVYYDVGAGFVTANMIEVSPNIYDAVIPPNSCGTTVKFYFSAEDARGEILYHPPLAASAPFTSLSALSSKLLFYDGIESAHSNWIKQNDPSLTSGSWINADPNGTTFGGMSAAPENDVTPDPGVQAFVTQNGPQGAPADANDVDGGPTSIISPVLDLAGGDAIIAYAQWFYTSTPGDELTISVSNDNGESWAIVANVDSTSNGTNTVWQNTSFLVSDFVLPTSQVRVRFSTADVSPAGIVEAGIDEFRVTEIVCGVCEADITGNGEVDVDDLLAVVNAWGPCAGCAADLNDSGIVDVDDLLTVINSWGTCE